MGDAKHYGSVYTMSDYESKVHNAYLTANFVPIPDLNIHATAAYNKAQAALDEVVMPDVEARLDGELENQDFTFPEMTTYSDLDFELIDLTLGFKYSLTPEVAWTAEGTFGTLWDYAPYVFGDETGSVFIVRTGLKIDF